MAWLLETVAAHSAVRWRAVNREDVPVYASAGTEFYYLSRYFKGACQGLAYLAASKPAASESLAGSEFQYAMLQGIASFWTSSFVSRILCRRRSLISSVQPTGTPPFCRISKIRYSSLRETPLRRIRSDVTVRSGTPRSRMTDNGI